MRPSQFMARMLTKEFLPFCQGQKHNALLETLSREVKEYGYIKPLLPFIQVLNCTFIQVFSIFSIYTHKKRMS